MGSQSYKRKETFKLHYNLARETREGEALESLIVSLSKYCSVYISSMRGSLREVIDFRVSTELEGFGDFSERHDIVTVEYKKVVSNKANQVCFLGLLLDLNTGDFLISDKKKDTYFSAFNIFKFLESYGIFITPEVLKYNIEQYKFNQISFKELFNNFQRGIGKVKSMTSEYLSADIDVSVNNFDDMLMLMLVDFNDLARVFRFYKILTKAPSFSEDFVEGEISDDLKSFLFNFRNAIVDIQETDVLQARVSRINIAELSEDDLEEILAQLTSGAHFMPSMNVGRMTDVKDLTPRKIRYALNLKDVLENDPDGELYLDEMFMGDIDSKELVDRIGLRDYVKGRFAGYSAQGFVHGDYETKIKWSSYVPDTDKYTAYITPEDESFFQSVQDFATTISPGTIMSFTNTTFRKLQRALRRMEQVT